MKKYKAILFDMDGTLLPMDYKTFMYGYFKMIMGVLSSLGDDPKTVFEGFQRGIEAMSRNDGSRNNKEAFWEAFKNYITADVEEYIRLSDAFYYSDFEKAKQFTLENPLAKKAVELAHRCSEKVVLATNPMFPKHAQIARISWVGLDESDFALVTDYESDFYTKPQREYYLSICERIGVLPEECLMVGNDEKEDMMGAESAGMDGYLVTDCLIPSETYHWSGERGSFAQLLKKLGDMCE